MATKEQIIQALATNDKAVGRALMLLKNRQTLDEQINETTSHLNGRGFKPCHARMGVSMGKFFEERGYLTEKQVAYWRKTEATGTMRIACYWRQLMEEAEAKAALKKEMEEASAKFFDQTPEFRPIYPGEDIGNYEEAKALWQETNGH